MQTLFPQFTQSLGRKIAWRPKESLRSRAPTNFLVGTRHAKTTGKPARSRLRLLYKTIYLACPINDRTRTLNLFDGTARRSTRHTYWSSHACAFPQRKKEPARSLTCCFLCCCCCLFVCLVVLNEVNNRWSTNRAVATKMSSQHNKNKTVKEPWSTITGNQKYPEPWTKENSWCVFRVRPPLSNFTGLVWKGPWMLFLAKKYKLFC